MKAAEAINQTSEAWDRCTDSEASRLLRLSLLRKLGGRLHALRSVALALDDRKLLGTVERIEVRLEALRKVPLPKTGRELKDLLLSADSTTPSTNSADGQREVSLPEPLHAALGGRDKLMRGDRVWERALARAACDAAWEFWALEAEIPLENVEAWHEQLTNRLWPEGVVLYVESGQPMVQEAKTWKGRWIVVSHCGERPETPPNGTLLDWKLLFATGGT